MNIVEFVRARLEEREQLAEAAKTSPYLDAIIASRRNGKATYRAFVAANDPVYVTGDIAAKRAILDLLRQALTMLSPMDSTVVALSQVIRHLAAIDKEHPDYDESWKP